MVSMQGSGPNALMKNTKQAPIKNGLNDRSTSIERHYDNEDDNLAVATLDKHGKVKLRVPQHLRPHITRKFLNNSQRNFTNALQEALTGIQLIDTSADLAKIQHACEYDRASAPLPTSRSTRSGRIPSGRDRPTWTQSPVDQFSGHPFELGPNDIDADGSDDELPPCPSPPLPKLTKMKSVLIADEEQVKAFLLDRLDRIQQLSDKKIAKAWIKGICPKKQAEYPYQNKRAPGVDVELPPFWPRDVKYKEPDHIQKEDRNKLLLHLIRLRPTPEEVRGWHKNQNQVSLNKTHQTIGWTAFLRELAPPECVDDIDNVKPEKVKKRKEYMKQMYDVALREEEYRCFGMGDDTLKYSYPDDDKPVKRYTTRQKKRYRSPQSTSDDESRTGSPSSSAGRRDRPIAKRLRKDLDAKPIVAAQPIAQASGIGSGRGEGRRVEQRQQTDADVAGAVDMASYETASGSPSAVDQKVVAGQHGHYRHADKSESSLPTDADWLASRQEFAAMHQTRVGATATTDLQHPEQQRAEYHQQQQLFQWQTASPATMSFGSASEPSTPPSFDVYQAQTGQSMFPGTHDFRFDASQGSHKPQRRPTSYPCQQNHEQPQGQHSHAPMSHHHHYLGMQGPPMSDAYPVFDVPQPSFNSTPDTPLFSSVDMLSHSLPISMPHDTGSNPAHLQVQQPAAPPQTQPNQHQAYTPVYDGHQFQYSSPDHHRHMYVPPAQPYESYNAPLQHGLPLQPAHGMPLQFMPANFGYPQHHC